MPPSLGSALVGMPSVDGFGAPPVLQLALVIRVGQLGLVGVRQQHGKGDLVFAIVEDGEPGGFGFGCLAQLGEGAVLDLAVGERLALGVALVDGCGQRDVGGASPAVPA